MANTHRERGPTSLDTRETGNRHLKPQCAPVARGEGDSTKGWWGSGEQHPHALLAGMLDVGRDQGVEWPHRTARVRV